jgi:hypothetical protein
MIIGIDPGKSGGVVITSTSKTSMHKCPSEPTGMASIIASAKNTAHIEGEKIEAFIEKVWAFPTDTRSSSFKFGTNYGMWIGILASNNISYTEVVPQVWMKEYQPLPKIKKERKNMLKQIAQEKFPTHRVTLNTSDAALIALWGESCQK